MDTNEPVSSFKLEVLPKTMLEEKSNRSKILLKIAQIASETQLDISKEPKQKQGKHVKIN